MKHHTSILQRLLEFIWYPPSPLATLGQYLLAPLSLVFCLLAWLKRKTDSRKAPSLTIPVIVIGNISIGGTGKTPLVIHLAQRLQAAGYKPCIITRGYKGTSRQWPLQVTKTTPAAECGDEAKLMALKTGIPVIAGADRVADIHYALQHTTANIILSDDGMQHYRMQRHLEIAVIDAQRGLGNRFCLPAGPLREPPARLTTCDFVIYNGGHTSQGDTMQLQAAALVNLASEERQPASAFSKVRLITGIGNPQRFIKTLETLGLDIVTAAIYPDHHAFTLDDFQDAEEELPWVMTEKDAVKCLELGLKNAWYLPVSARLDHTFEQRFLSRVDAVAAQVAGHSN